MAKTKEQKQEILKDLEKNLKEQNSMVLIDYGKVPSSALFALRNKLKEAECLLKVVKKTLLEKVLEKLDKKEVLEKVKAIKSQLVIAFGFNEETAPVKICCQEAKENENIEILGGFLGKDFLEKNRIIELSELPSKEELLSRLVGSLQSPVSKLANVLNNNIKGLINVFNALSNK